MDLTLAEAARALGKSDRQVRYLIRCGRLPARKVDGRWRIQREDLPLSEGQRRAEEIKKERAARIALEVLQPAVDQPPGKRFSVQELRAYREGAPLYRALTSRLGDDHPAVACLREALMLLACGCHEFHGRKKAEYYARSREQLSRTAMALLLVDEEAGVPAVRQLEQSILPAIGGLIRQAERRERNP